MKRPSGKLRIIGGQWRSRLVEFDPGGGIRPTPDRVRQTLFDWLAPVIEGARCLDLFAGSGALGLEALSRGAGHVTFIENGAAHCALIRAAVSKFGATARTRVLQEDGLSFLSDARRPAPDARFDVVFLDPPYGSDLLAPALARLPPVLNRDNRVYFERRLREPSRLPAGYTLLREKKAGQVSYALATYAGGPA